MARKKASTDPESSAPPAGEPGPAPIHSDPATLDQEDRRRVGNQRRRYVKRRVFRGKRLELVAEKDPELHEELLRLRHENPHDYRKTLTRWLVRNDLYVDRLYTSRESPAPLMERYGKTTGGDGEE